MITPLALLVIACQLIVFALAIWCQLTPRLRTGSIATAALGCLAIASLLGLRQPTDTALHLLFWLPAAALLIVIAIRGRVPDGMSHIKDLRWPPPRNHRRNPRTGGTP